MALPKINTVQYDLKLPASGKKIEYRPFLVKEEKILLMAMESENEKEMITGVRQIITNCVSGENFDVDKIPLFDIEYLLLHLRGVSMGGVVTMKYKNNTCKKKNCKPLSVDIDILESQIKKDPDHNPKIELARMAYHLQRLTNHLHRHRGNLDWKPSKLSSLFHLRKMKRSYM